MPTWLAVTVIVATVATVCVVYNFWQAGPQDTGGQCHTNGCNFHNSNQRSEQSNESSERHERYDTPPNFRQRHTVEDCPICLDPLFYAPQHTLPCRHRLHSECFIKFRSQSDSCPICRRAL